MGFPFGPDVSLLFFKSLQLSLAFFRRTAAFSVGHTFYVVVNPVFVSTKFKIALPRLSGEPPDPYKYLMIQNLGFFSNNVEYPSNHGTTMYSRIFRSPHYFRRRIRLPSDILLGGLANTLKRTIP